MVVCPLGSEKPIKPPKKRPLTFIGGGFLFLKKFEPSRGLRFVFNRFALDSAESPTG